MEARQYPAAILTATFAGGVLNIEGTTKADAITVRQVDGQLSVTGIQITSANASKVNSISTTQVQRIVVNSLAGNDTIRFEGAGAGSLQDIVIAAVINGGDGIDTITAGMGADSIIGGLGNDVINGGGGIDTLVETANVNMTLTNSQLTGVGTDSLTSIELARLTGGAGNNTINAAGFAGSVTLDGGSGNDLLIGGSLADSLIGGSNNDVLVGNGGNDVLEGGAGNDTLTGGEGDDRFVFSGRTQLGTDTVAVADSAGTNTLDFSNFISALTRLDLLVVASQTVNSNLKLLLNGTDAIDNVVGTDLADLVFGNGLNNSLFGRGGNDTLAGNGGNDLLDGGASNDSLDGGAGDDTVLGGDGDDELFSGTGTNSIDGGLGQDTIDGISEGGTFAISQILAAYNTGRVNVQQVMQFIVDSGFAQDLPVIQESLGELMGVVEKLKSAFNRQLDGTKEDIQKAISDLAAVGFRLEYVGSNVDASGDLLRITFDRTFNQDRPRVSIGDQTGINYFDESVNGKLSFDGFTAQSPSVRVKMTFGVDVVSGTPSFYLADSSFVSFDNLQGIGKVSGEMAIRYLAGVKAVGTLVIDLDGKLSLKDSDTDHKLRVSDLSKQSSFTGDVDGSIVLNVDMNTDLPVLEAFKWHGTWHSNFLDGNLTIGTPKFDLPSIDALKTGIFSSLFDMKGSFDFLGPIRDALFSKIDILDTSIGDASGLAGKLGWLINAVDDTSAALKDAGFEFAPFTLDTVRSLINGDRVDLVKFHRQDSGTLWEQDGSFLVAAIPIVGPLAVTVSGTFGAEVGWNYAVGFGVDTTGVWIDSGTHIAVHGGVRAGIAAELTLAGIVGIGLEAGLGVQVSVGLGLQDPDASDGRIYMDEIFGRAGEENRSLVEAIGDVTNFYARLDATGYARSELNLPWPLPNITLFDESFQLAAIASSQGSATQTTSLRRISLATQAGKTLPAILQADGTLVITGTAERDFVSLSGGDGKVDVKWSGYQPGHFENVRKVVFHGGDNDDQLSVADNFNVAIEADGGTGNDLLTGGTLNDTLRGGAGDDRLLGRAGNDLLQGNEGRDEADGGAGDDQIEGGSGDDILFGGSDNDRVDGQVGNDAIEGNSGDDILTGNVGDDAVHGGDGNDELDGSDGNDMLNGEADDDVLRGGVGEDSLSGGIGNDQLWGGVGKDTLAGNENDDQLFGEQDNDLLLGGEGHDIADGASGDDLVQGDAGDDELIGGEGDDTLRGGDDNDILHGNRGDDVLNGDDGADELNGDEGEDTISVSLSTTDTEIVDILRGGVDRDRLWIAPVTNPLRSNAATGRLDWSTGDNWILVSQTGLNDFSAEQRDAVTGELVAMATFTLSGGTDTDIETLAIAGMDGNDRIEVTAETTRDLILDGGDGEDTLIGGGGRDILRGQDGDDSLVGNCNDDELHGGDGNDTLAGGDGTDRLYGERDADSMESGAGFDVQYGGEGDDTISAGEGLIGDLIYGEVGNDSLIGGDGRDVIFGGVNNDTIFGGGFGDVLMGDAGDDRILGQAGDDVILGGADKDELFAEDEETVTTIDQLFSEFLPLYNQLLGRELEITHPSDTIDGELELIVKQLERADLEDDERKQLEQQAQRLRIELQTLNHAELEVLRNVDFNRDGEPDKGIDTDIVDGGDGDDVIHGGRYHDHLVGGAGSDQFIHSAGNDVVVGGTDSDRKDNDVYLVRGTEQDDVIQVNGEQNPTTTNLEFNVIITTGTVGSSSHIILSPDIEAIGVLGLGADDKMYANVGKNALKDIRFEGGDGDDTLDVREMQSKTTLLGGAGNDWILGGLSTDSIDGGAGNDSLFGNYGIDTVHGGQGRDFIDGGEDIDYLYGDADNDELRGGIGGNGDYLDGGDGNDSLNGEYGSDTLIGGIGDDTLKGGYGNDTLQGGAGNDILLGGAENDSLDGGDGNDTIEGGTGIDRIFGGSGNDEIYGRHPRVWSRMENASADSGNYLDGGDGNDLVIGDLGNDTLNGDVGEDTLVGNGGSDTFTGGFAPVDWGNPAKITTTTNALGNKVVFLISSADNQIYGLRFDHNGNPVGGFFSVGHGTAIQIAVGHDASNRPVLYAINGDDHQVYGMRLNDDGTPRPVAGDPAGQFFHVGYGMATQIAVTQEASNRPVLFAISTGDRQVYKILFNADGTPLSIGGDPRGMFFLVGSGTATQIVATRDVSNKPVLYAISGGDHRVYGILFNADGTTFPIAGHPNGLFFKVGNLTVSQIIVGNDSSMRPQLLATGEVNGQLYALRLNLDGTPLPIVGDLTGLYAGVGLGLFERVGSGTFSAFIDNAGL